MINRHSFPYAARCLGAVGMALLMARCGGGPSGLGCQHPTVLAVTPADGPRIGGTSIHISGTNFGDGATVTIGGVPATDVVVESFSVITARTAPSSPGPADVAVTVGGRTGTLSGAFNYLAVSGEPPIIASLAARGLRPNEPPNFADLGEEINVAATVEDPDTPADQLVFQWSADTGTFVDTGASVKWQAPADIPTPATITLSVTVSDTTGNSASSSTTISVHDSVMEIGNLARDFLLDFSDSNKDPAFVVRNFSKSPRCERERDEEFTDVENNRTYFHIDSANVGAATVTVQFGTRPCSFESRDGDACAAVPVTWQSTCVRTNPTCSFGERPRVTGTDFVTASYEQSQWRLCASHFNGAAALRPNFIR